MAETVNLEHLGELVAQLPPLEQLKLAARICAQLSVSPLAAPLEQSTNDRVRQERLAKLDAWLDACENVAALWDGEFDSAADLRRIRNEEG